MAETDTGAVNGIRVERDGPAGIIWLERADRGNAFTSAMQAELHLQLAALDRDDGIRAIIVTGAGKLFSAGADMEPGGANFAFGAERYRQAKAEMAARARPWQLRTPIIGALNGSAVGLGLTFAMQWDIRIVNETAKYGFVFTRRGLIPEQNSLWLLPKLVGVDIALELLMTGRIFTGAEAARLRVATESVAGDQVLNRAREIAEEIATHTAPASVGITKQLLYELLSETDRESAFAREWEAFRAMGRRDDATEGVASFLEKRAPAFDPDKHVAIPEYSGGWSETS